ncbi:hypothetical protein FVQ98_06715 [Ottowia sp. GY511]|uniref:Uncharacterized protein n=1 Tax=Ottowia flava TaxID=2675430 RepID=A0ABW4KSV5_9BURK|nr:hypothetical protein [Ottowia sp. GY511]TXK30987.1 hypothetical protein FVQ98_06715 [Ottowia sp. GY511]
MSSRKPFPDLRTTARTLIGVTAQAWQVEMGMGCGQPTLVPGPRRLRSTRARPAARATAPVDVSAGQWPYWPAYPGLAAHWR